MDKACPACAGKMIDGPEARGAWGCTQCGGVWAGIGASNQFASVLDPSVRELADVAQKHAERMGHRPLAIPRACPECRVPLAQRMLGPVVIDVCMSHGTWFDRGELQAVADARLGKKPAAASAGAPETGGFPSRRGENLAADIAVGAIALFFSILTD